MPIYPGGQTHPGPQVGTPNAQLGGNKYTTAVSVSNAPRCLVRIGTSTPQKQQVSQYISQVLDYEIVNSVDGSMDTGRVRIPMMGYSDAPRSYVDFPALTQQGAVLPIEIFAGFADPKTGQYSIGSLNRRFTGVVDSYDMDPLSNEVIFHCRSYAAVILDTKTTIRWQNKTTVDVLNIIAKKHGMTTVVKMPTVKGAALKPLLMEDVYRQDQVIGSRSVREWDLLIAAAQADDCRLWVDGTVIYYVGSNNLNAQTLHLQYGRDLENCIVTHSPQFSKDIEVQVRTYEPNLRTSTKTITKRDASGNVVSGKTHTTVATYVQQFGYRQTASSSITYNEDGTTTSGTGISSQAGGSYSGGYTHTPTQSLKEKYILHVQGRSRDAVNQQAIAYWRQLSEHEFQAHMTFAMTPDNYTKVKRDTAFILSNYPSPSCNQQYHAKRLTERFEVSQTEGGNSHGWNIEVITVNHVPPMPGTL